MSSIVSLPLHRTASRQPSRPLVGRHAPAGGSLLRLIGDALRRTVTARQLRRLDDRLLRDVGLTRDDVASPVLPGVVWDGGTGTYLQLGRR